MKYYYREHVLGYRRVKAEGKTAWGEIQGGSRFENFAACAFLEVALPQLIFSTRKPAVLVYGCGTGPECCFLAERGFQVRGMDIIPTAIEMAKDLAKERNLDIHCEVQDICELPHEGKRYDMIVDGYCLQCIVTEADRQAVFAAVRARLKAEGCYLVTTAMFDEERYAADERFTDPETGATYNRYGNGIIDPSRSIVYIELKEGPDGYEDAVRIHAKWHLPNRKHLKGPALKAEMEAAGFRVLYQDEGLGGSLVCAPRESGST